MSSSGNALTRVATLALSAMMVLCGNTWAADDPAANVTNATKGADVAKPVKVTKTASGIEISVLREGSGATPKGSDTVRVHYRGRLTDGKEFDSSYRRGQPATFPLTRVIPCWTEGVQSIRVGGTSRLVCPPNLAYGARGVPGVIPPDSTLMFEIELLDIVK